MLPQLPQLPPCTPSRDFFVRRLPQLPFTGAPSYPVYSAGYLSYPSYPPCTPSRDFFVRRLPQLPFTGAPSYPVYSACYLSYPSYPPAHPVVIFLYAGYLSYLSQAHPVTLFTVQVTSVTPVTPAHPVMIFLYSRDYSYSYLSLIQPKYEANLTDTTKFVT